MKEIYLTQGKITIVDDDDYEHLMQWKWCANLRNGNKWYASRVGVGQRGSNLYMHRYLVDCPKDLEVDHINGDGLDNRRSNLRVCTHKQNTRNQRSRRGSSVFKGVYWNNKRKIWIACVYHQHKNMYLGGFLSEVEAAERHDEAVRSLKKEFGRYNFPRKGEQSALPLAITDD